MESKGEIYISPKHHKDDYLKLDLNLGSEPSVWESAVEILKDRIYGRFFNQIDSLSEDILANGFAIMALNCLLIEALFQFRTGKKETPSKNGEVYAGFLRETFPSDFANQEIAKRFYKDIRCGILHSAQTQNESRLSDDPADIAVKMNNGTLTVFVSRLTDVLKEYFDNYMRRLLDVGETELRENFINKMKFVCRK